MSDSKKGGAFFPPRGFLTIKEASRRLRSSEMMVRRAIDRGDLPASPFPLHLGSLQRMARAIRYDDLEAYMNQLDARPGITAAYSRPWNRQEDPCDTNWQEEA